MANEEQVNILKQGIDNWNAWRNENRSSKMDFIKADLYKSNLSHADLYGANLTEANLRGVTFSGADLRGANLTHVDLREANLNFVDLTGANLKDANLKGARLLRAKLNEASLYGANLVEADLSGADLTDTDLATAKLAGTTIARTNLSKTHGLEDIIHLTPSPISTDTIQLTKGDIPDVFLRGCGLSDWEIESAKLYKPGISNEEINSVLYKIFDLRAHQAIQISPLFISYSHADTAFVEKLEPQLTNLGIRFWRDFHNAISGRLEKQIDHAMHQYPTVILILSENSITSDWVEHEARLARELEKEKRMDVLCPIALDDTWKTAKWPARLMEQIKEYNILDFSKWNDDQAFNKVFSKMISGLDMFYRSDAESLNS